MGVFAIIDMGTNTFNLLVFEFNNQKLDYLFENRIAVKLGEGSITKDIISKEATERAIKALKAHLNKLSEFKVNSVSVFATSAVRSAQNQTSFLKTIKKETGLKIEVISGEREAELIYKGVKSTINYLNEPYLILDIGGGSNELIIANNNEIFWKKSFNLGVARLLARYPHPDPISKDTLENILREISAELKPLSEALKTYPANILVGASGAFDTLVKLENKLYNSTIDLSKNSFRFNPITFDTICKKLLFSTNNQRAEMDFIPAYRKEMIVMGMVFLTAVLNLQHFKEIYQSNYALKEGVMAEIINL